MFTGLIQNVGKLRRFIPRGLDAELEIESSFTSLEIGESIAVMGACLSVTSAATGLFSAFASRETLTKTDLLGLPAGSRVNLERALKVGDPLGGHLVSGHVDTRVALIDRQNIGRAEKLVVELPKRPLDSQVAAKGSVALDGVSLTVNEVGDKSFDLMVIPLTLEQTTLGAVKPGQLMNLETDILAKYVERQLKKEDEPTGGVDLSLLTQTGFVR